MDAIKVSRGTNPKSLAGSIAIRIKDYGYVYICAVGAGAVNQAIKAIAILRGYLKPTGYDVLFIPSFIDVIIDGEERTGISMKIVSYIAEHNSISNECLFL